MDGDGWGDRLGSMDCRSNIQTLQTEFFFKQGELGQMSPQNCPYSAQNSCCWTKKTLNFDTFYLIAAFYVCTLLCAGFFYLYFVPANQICLITWTANCRLHTEHCTLHTHYQNLLLHFTLHFTLDELYIHQCLKDPVSQGFSKNTFVINLSINKTSLLRRLQGRPSPAEASPIGKRHPFSKTAVTLNHWWDFDSLRDLESSQSLWHSFFYNWRCYL